MSNLLKDRLFQLVFEAQPLWDPSNRLGAEACTPVDILRNLMNGYTIEIAGSMHGL